MRQCGGRQRERREPGFPDAQAPQHFLNFLPLPQGHGSFLPTFCLVIGVDGPTERGGQTRHLAERQSRAADVDLGLLA